MEFSEGPTPCTMNTWPRWATINSGKPEGHGSCIRTLSMALNSPYTPMSSLSVALLFRILNVALFMGVSKIRGPDKNTNGRALIVSATTKKMPNTQKQPCRITESSLGT